MSFAQNSTFGFLTNGSGSAVFDSADNGLSRSTIDNTTVVLGQDFGDVTNPAATITPRQIPITPSTFIEFTAGQFSTGGQSVVGISNDYNISGLFGCLTLVAEDNVGAAVLDLQAQAANGFGCRVKISAENGSGYLAVLGQSTSIPAGLRNSVSLSSNNNNSNITFQTAPRVLVGNFAFWGDDGAAQPQEYYRIVPPVSAVLDFASTNAQNSRDLTVNVPGAELGDHVWLGVPNGSVNANSCYTAFVSSSGVVTVRFNNYSSGAIDPASGTFKIGVIRILP